MTVEELICKLQPFPKDRTVCLLDTGSCGGDWEIDTVEEVQSDQHENQIVLLSRTK